MDRIICIVGPTGTGKTRLSIAMAKRLNAEVVSCDSMQVYRRMDIGTAKPNAAEMDGVVHHMIDVAEPWEDYSVGRYVPEANRAVEEILSRGKGVLVVGGTGLYADALISGRDFAPGPSGEIRSALEARADETGMEAMLEELRRVDPEAAARLHVSDRKRILRALEVFQETGNTISEHNARTRQIPDRWQPVWIGLDYQLRSDLYARIDRRVEAMLEAGLLDEITNLLREGIPETATSLQAIGYKEFLPVLRGELSLEEAKEQVQRASRRYAKRQLTWFRRRQEMHWLKLPKEPDFTAAEEEILCLLEEPDVSGVWDMRETD